MVTSKKGRIFRRKDGKHVIYIPMYIALDSMFPFPLDLRESVPVKVSFKIGQKKLTIEEWKEN